MSTADIDSGSVRVGAVIYSTDVHIQFNLNTYKTKQEILDAFGKIPFIYGSTNTYGALNVMRTQMFTRENGDRPDVHNIVMLITDGVSNVNPTLTVPEAIRAQAENIQIYAVGIGLADTSELAKIASKPATENTFTVQDFAELDVLKHTIFDAFCQGMYKKHTYMHTYIHTYRYV